MEVVSLSDLTAVRERGSVHTGSIKQNRQFKRQKFGAGRGYFQEEEARLGQTYRAGRIWTLKEVWDFRHINGRRTC